LKLIIKILTNFSMTGGTLMQWSSFQNTWRYAIWHYITPQMKLHIEFRKNMN